MIMVSFLMTLLSGILYRIGGAGKEEINWANTRFRDIGCSLLCVLYLGIFGHWHWTLIFCFGLLWGSLTTYWDELFGFDNYWFHGFMCGMAFFPYAIAYGLYWQIGAVAFTIAVLMGGWSAIFKNVWIEETGRGVFLLLPLYLLVH